MTKKHIVISLCLAAVLIMTLAPDTYARKSLHDVRTWVYIHETEGHPWGEVAMRPGEPEQDNRTLFFVYIPSVGHYVNPIISYLVTRFSKDSGISTKSPARTNQTIIRIGVKEIESHGYDKWRAR